MKNLMLPVILIRVFDQVIIIIVSYVIKVSAYYFSQLESLQIYYTLLLLLVFSGGGGTVAVAPRVYGWLIMAG